MRPSRPGHRLAAEPLPSNTFRIDPARRLCAARRTRRSWVAGATIDRLDTGRRRRLPHVTGFSGLPATESEIPTIFAGFDLR
jgi:hypothetical protein